jgi:hypoxanthine-guanine phosphoribosyltransferase
MANGDLHEQIARLEVRIEELAEAIDRCRKIILTSKVAMTIGGILILATLVRAISFDPVAVTVAIASIIGGTVVFGSNISTRRQMETAMESAEAARAELISQIDLRVIGDGRYEG